MDGTEELVDVIAPRKESTLFCLLELRSTGREEWRENTQATAQGMGRRPAREKEKRTQRQKRTRTHIMGARVPVQVDERRMPHKGKVLLASNRGLCSLGSWECESRRPSLRAADVSIVFAVEMPTPHQASRGTALSS